MKKKFLLITSVALLCVSLFGCKNKKEEKILSNIDAATEADMVDYTALSSNDNFAEISYDTLASCIGNEKVNAIIYMGYPACDNCQSAIKDIQDAAIAAEQTVYYFNVSKAIDTDEDYDRIIELLSPVLKADDTNADELAIYTPHIFLIIDGQLVQGHVGYTEDYDYSKLMDINTIKKEISE